MNLLSINTSLPIDIEVQGKMITTGIFKEPVEGAVFVDKVNLKDDLQADLKNHGGEHKAVYAFSSDHYSYWSNVLQNSELTPGIFGENLTISGFDESTLQWEIKICRVYLSKILQQALIFECSKKGLLKRVIR